MGEIIISLVISLATVVCALLLSMEVADHTKGRNFSDVGIPLYTHGGRALILGILTYILSIITVFIIVRLLWKSRNFMYVFGVVNIFFFLIVCFALTFAFG